MRVSVIVVVLIGSQGMYAQTSQRSFLEISGGMGISAFAAPSVVDYINGIAQANYTERVPEFSSMTEFFVSPEISITDSWSCGIDYAYRIKSFSVIGGFGPSQFEYSAHQPGVVLHYVIPGEGYLLKFGGGVSFVRATLSEALYGNAIFSEFRATGGSIKLEAIGNTQFDEIFYGHIALDARWVVGGDFRNAAASAHAGSVTAGLGSFAVGIKLGVMFRL